MRSLPDLSTAPLVWLVVVLAISVIFVTIPVMFAARLLRERRRARTWEPVTAELTDTRTETTGSEHRRTRVLGRWRYRDRHGVEQTGEGDLQGAWLTEPGEGPRTVQVLVDPLDPTRSQPRRDLGHPAMLGCFGAITAIFGVLGVLLVVATLSALLSRLA